MTSLQTTLHAATQVLMYPVIILLIGCVVYALFAAGMTIAEYFRERRYFNAVMPKLLHGIKEATPEQMPEVIESSGLLKSQRVILSTVFDNRDLDEESRWALARRLLVGDQQRKAKRVSRNEVMSRLSPMLGLMGTLIPLGPGIVAFGQGDPTTMAGAMLVAFDTTVTGLVAAAILLVLVRIRRNWYAEYDSSLQASVTALLEKIDNMSAAERTADATVEQPACDPTTTQEGR